MSLGWSRAVCFLFLTGCTPLGLWLYEDPVVTVSRVTFESGKPRPSGASPVIVALAVQNVNDYPLTNERLELSLRLDGIPIGVVSRDSTVAVETDTVSTVAVALPIQPQAPSVDEVLASGTHTFAVQGRAFFHTPIGIREVRFAQAGPMLFGKRSVP